MPEKLLSCKNYGDAIFQWRGSKPFDRHPDLAVKVAKIVAQWSTLETALSRIFIAMLGSDPVPGAAIYASLTSAAAQKAALRAAAATALPTDQRNLFEVLLGLYNTAQKERNKLVHWVWGYGTKLEDALILADPACFISHSAQSIRFESEGKTVTPDFDFDKVYVYRARDFDQLSEQIEKLMQHLASFLIVITPSIGPGTSSPWTSTNELRQLLNQPEIRKSLLRLLRQQKAHP